MRVKDFGITWLHKSRFDVAIAMNKRSGFMHQDLAWLKRLYKLDGVFSMGVFSANSDVLGWATYRKTTSGIEILWMIVDDGFRYRGVGTAMIDRMKTWIGFVKHRRGALTCSVNQYADDMLYFLHDRGFRCFKVNQSTESYRMIWLSGNEIDE